MEYAEKHYIIPQNQMNKLRAGNARETIQQVVENDLDVTSEHSCMCVYIYSLCLRVEDSISYIRTFY